MIAFLQVVASRGGLRGGWKGSLKRRLGGDFKGGWVLKQSKFLYMWWGRAKRAPAAYTKTCPRTPERGQSKGSKNLKQRRSPRGALKSVPGGSLRESVASVVGF